MKIDDILQPLSNMIKYDDKPVVIFSAMWPLLKATKIYDGDLGCRNLLDLIYKITDERILLMPTFARGFVNGICDLDNEPSQTGILTELFRKQNGVKRTICPYFSFSFRGNNSSKLLNLKNKDAWGNGSLYEWMYKNDVHIVTIGVHPTHCSFTHYAEWLKKDKIFYRHNKTFSGNVIYKKKMMPYKTTLLVRDVNYKVRNDFLWLLDIFKKNGMQHAVINGISISEISARVKIDIVTDQIDKNPYALIKQNDRFQ